MAKNFQLYVSAYMVFDNKVFLEDRLGKLWVPIGTHTYKNNNDTIKDDEEIIKNEIKAASSNTPYKLFGDNAGFITRTFKSRSDSGVYTHKNTVYFGAFEKKPETTPGKVQLFSLDDLSADNIIEYLRPRTLDLAMKSLEFYERYVCLN